MIRSHEQGTPKRRIAVIEIHRPQRARMGSIGPAPPPVLAWTTISDEPADSSANWLSMKLLEQARARQTTPGTLTYTPASDTPAPNVAPWNSWLMPNCDPTSADATPAPPAPSVAGTSDYPKVWLAIGLITAAASLTYLFNNEHRR
jgi:hypothetical protein